jgi:DNA-binding transcriptional MerR regulator
MVGLYTTQQVAKEVGVSKSTIQFYRQIGFIEPCDKTKGGYLLFSYGTIEKMITIMKLRQNGKSVEEIRNYFKEMRMI